MTVSPTYKPLQKARLYEQVVEQIQQTIIDGKLKPGDRLASERDLAEMFQVGRPTIREALRTLGIMGLIEVRTGQKGSIVRACDISHYVETLRIQLSWLVKADERTREELWEVRKPIERAIAHAAAANATPKDMKTLKGLIRKMASSAGDMPGYFALALEFHRELARATRNRVYPLIWQLLDDILLQIYVPNLDRLFPKGPSKLLYGNEVLLEAIASRDPAGIDRALATHAEAENIFETCRARPSAAKKGRKP
jgi:GntR family transcriptional regulator, transcriptional repressor for pyruvate dehydrogenase complex